MDLSDSSSENLNSTNADLIDLVPNDKNIDSTLNNFMLGEDLNLDMVGLNATSINGLNGLDLGLDVQKMVKNVSSEDEKDNFLKSSSDEDKENKVKDSILIFVLIILGVKKIFKNILLLNLKTSLKTVS